MPPVIRRYFSSEIFLAIPDLAEKKERKKERKKGGNREIRNKERKRCHVNMGPIRGGTFFDKVSNNKILKNGYASWV
jgi:hypothetical protein